jgi:glycosyltransferase involved in cell wall biosynthesis
MMSKPKLLWVSDNPHLNFVGQSIVTRQTLKRLQEHYEVHVLGYGKADKEKWTIGETLPYPIHSGDRYDDKRMLEVCQAIQPDVMVCSHDIFMFATLKLIKQNMPAMKIVGWYTIDGDPIPAIYRQILSGTDMVVSPTAYGKDAVEKQFFDIPVKVIPYGINHDDYKPSSRENALGNMSKMGISFSPQMTEKLVDPSTFIGIFWGHNHSKKNIPAIVRAWKAADLSPEKSHLILVLHSHEVVKGQITVMGDWDYTAELIMDGTEPITLIDSTFADSLMSKFVQLSNVVLFPSIGEGFGLPPMEGMACGLVPIVTNFAGTNDFCKHGHNALLVGGEMITGELGIRRIMASSTDIRDRIRLLHKMYLQPQVAFSIPPAYGGDMLAGPQGDTTMNTWEQMSKNAIQTANKFQWDKTAGQWHQLLQTVLKPEFERNLVHVAI